MANKLNIKNVAAVILMAAAMVSFSCSKLAEEEKQNFVPNIGYGKETVSRPDSLVEITFKTPYEKYADNGIEYGITVVFKGSDGKTSEEPYKYVRPYVHTGVAAQYFHWSDVAFTTTYGEKTKLDDVKGDPDGYWQATYISELQKFAAVNASKKNFEHSTTTGAYEVVFTFPDKGNVKGFSYKFEAPSWTVGMEQLENEKVSGISYEGKIYSAVKYECSVPATFSIPYDLRVSGEEYEKEVEASNLAFFLEHVIDVRMDELNYVGKFYQEGKTALKTKEQRDFGKLVTYDNGEPTDEKTPFDLEMNLQVVASQPEDSWVETEEELKDKNFTYKKGDATETPVSKDVFTGKKVSGMDSIELSDRTITLDWEWVLWAWGEKVLPHAKVSIDWESIQVTSEKDEQLSKLNLAVYTVTVSVDAVVSFEEIERESETCTIEVSYRRYMNVADDITYDYEGVDFGLELYNETPSRVASKREFVTIKKTTLNHGEVVTSSQKTHELNMWVELSAGDTLTVEKAHTPKVTSVEDKAGKGAWKQQADEDGFDIRWREDSQLIRTDDGHVMTLSRHEEELTRNGKTGEYNYGFTEGMKSTAFKLSEPVLVDSVKTTESVTRIYRVDVEVTPVVKTTEPATKAGNENVNTFAAAASIYQKVVEGDEYVEGADEVEEFVEPNANGGIDAGIKLYENYTLSGRRYVGEDRVSFAYDITGGSESDVEVESVSNMSQSGNGHSGLGSGTYTNYIVNNGTNYAQKFNWKADGAKTAKVSGKSGKGAERTFTPSFIITDTGLTEGTQTTEGVYTVYPRYSNAKGTLSLKNVSVSKDATSSRNFKVKTPDQITGKRTDVTYKKNGQSVDYTATLYETWRDKGEKVKDTKSGNVPFTFVGGSEADVVVSSVSNMSQSGNGRTGSGKGTYTNYINDGTQSYAQNFTFDAPASFDVVLNGTNGPETVNIPVSFKIADTGLTSGNQSTSGEYYVYPYASNAKATLTVGTVSVSKDASSTRNFKMKTPDQITDKRTTVEYKQNGQSIDYTAKLYETSRDKGEYLKDSKSGNVPFTFDGGSEADVVVSSVSNMSQSGNGRTGSGKGTYTNYINDGTQSYAQNFTFDAPASFDVVLNGTNGNEIVNIPVSFVITDTGLTNGAQSTTEDYYVYPYTSNAKGSLTVGTVTVSKDASSSRNFKVKRSVPKIIPDDWGKIVSAGFSAVPAHLVNEGAGFVNGNVEDGSGAQTAATCMSIITDKGAVPVIFGWADAEPIVPTTAQILGSTFTAGSYDSSYNSGYYNTYSTSIGAMNRWVPAKGYDTGNGITYDVQGIPQIRYVRNEALVMWGWRGGNYSCMLPSYKCTVNDGTLTVTYNGKVVLEIR